MRVKGEKKKDELCDADAASRPPGSPVVQDATLLIYSKWEYGKEGDRSLMGKALHDKRGARCARGPITAERRGHFITKVGVWHWRCHKNIMNSRDNSTAESLTSRGQPGTLTPSPHQQARVDRWTE